MTRKIIQISTCTNTGNLAGTTQDYNHYITALCDDGTVWIKLNKGDWFKVRDIPQDDPKKQPQAAD